MDQTILEKRIKRLEIQNRLLIFSFVFILFLSFNHGCETNPAAQTVRCSKLEVVDQNGSVMAMIGTDADGSRGLFLYDEQANLRVATIYDSTQSAFYAIDSEGAIRAGLAQYAHGGGGLALHGAGSKGGAVLYFKNSGSLSFYDGEGRTTMRIPDQDTGKN